jgi:hypothetical protein
MAAKAGSSSSINASLSTACPIRSQLDKQKMGLRPISLSSSSPDEHLPHREMSRTKQKAPSRGLFI